MHHLPFFRPIFLVPHLSTQGENAPNAHFLRHKGLTYSPTIQMFLYLISIAYEMRRLVELEKRIGGHFTGSNVMCLQKCMGPSADLLFSGSTKFWRQSKEWVHIENFSWYPVLPSLAALSWEGLCLSGTLVCPGHSLRGLGGIAGYPGGRKSCLWAPILHAADNTQQWVF